MKKIVLSIVVLMLAAPAMAIQDVNFVVVDEGAGVVAIYYDSNSPPGPLPRAFSLDVTVDDGNIVSLSDLSLKYWVYPGSIDINDAGEVNDVGTPEADPCDLPSDTQPGLGSSGITLEMGSLYVGGPNAPDPCALLIKVMVADANECNLTVTGNVGRGKTVMEGAAQGVTNLPITIHVGPIVPPTYTISGNVASGAAPIKNMVGVTIAGLPGPPVTDGSGNYTATVNAGFTGTTTVTVAQWTIPGKSYTNVQADALNEDYTATATECLASTDPGYSYWSGTTFNKPDCWCYIRQCNGDTNNGQEFFKWVMLTDLNVLKAAYNKSDALVAAASYGGVPAICADFDHAKEFFKTVMLNDLNILKTNYNQATVGTCPDTHINAWKP